jgi:hypothetical protein
MFTNNLNGLWDSYYGTYVGAAGSSKAVGIYMS